MRVIRAELTSTDNSVPIRMDITGIAADDSRHHVVLEFETLREWTSFQMVILRPRSD